MVARLCLLLFLALAGCADKLVPDEFNGPTAVVKDSYTNYVTGGLLGADRADFFVMSKADGKMIEDALQRTDMANYGKGFYMKPEPFERRVPIKPMEVTLHGIRHYAAPIAEIVSKTYEVERKVRFTPAAGAIYVVRGKLGDSGSSVWIETEGGQIIMQ